MTGSHDAQRAIGSSEASLGNRASKSTRQAAKRGGGELVGLTLGMDRMQPQSADVVAVDDALTALADRDEQQARIVELRFFG